MSAMVRTSGGFRAGLLIGWTVGLTLLGVIFGVMTVVAVAAVIEGFFRYVDRAVTRDLGLPEDIVNVEGGAIAHGHPIGATGAVLLTRLIHSMRRDGLRHGIVTLCIGGGQGIALAIEMVS